MSSGNRRARKRVAAAGMAVLLGGVGLASVPMAAQATPSFTLTRLAGNTRVETAVAISADTFPTATTAMIVNDNAFPDALAGNYLAAETGSPILLSGLNAAPAATMAELTRLGVTNVTLLGGTSVLAEAVETQMEAAGYVVERVAGTNRFGTAAAIAQARPASEVGTNEDGMKTAVVSSGFDANFPDALAAGPVVYAQNFPQLLTPSTEMAAEIPGAIDALGIQHVILTGGTGAISAAVETAIAGEGVTVERIAGGDRFGTATELADKAIDDLGHVDTHVNVAFARKFPDALAGGPHAGEEASTIVLSETASVDPTTCAFLTARAATLSSGDLFGGTAVVSDTTKAGREACAGGGVGAGAGTGIVIDFGAGEYTFVEDGTGEEIVVDFDNTEDGSDDTYTVDDAPATQAAFEAALSLGDEVSTDDDNDPDTPDSHDLVNVEVTSGVVGNADTAGNTFDIIEPVSDTILASVDYLDGAVFTVDGAAANVTEFEDDINEGDTIVVDQDDPLVPAVSDGFDLTNETLSGPVTSISGGDVTIDDLGDDPATNQNDDFEVDGADDIVIDGDDTATLADFTAAAGAGDDLSYSREGGVETYELTNGTLTGTMTGFGIFSENAGTDEVLVLTADDTYVVVDYTGADIEVDGAAATDTDAEDPGYDGFTPGDTVTYSNDGTTEELSLTNEDLTGFIDDVDTGAPTTYDVVLAEGDPLLAVVDYTGDLYLLGDDEYFVNGVEVTDAEWVDALDDLDLADGEIDDAITVSETVAATQHDLDTDDV